MMINIPSGSVMDELRVKLMFLFIKIETSLCLLLNVDEKILSNCLQWRCCNSVSVKCVSCKKQISAFNLMRWLMILILLGVVL